MAPAHHYRFANFVAGPANQAALAAAVAAARQPGEQGRLLVIAGGVGLGKTHLSRAVVNEARAARPRLRAAYHAGDALMRPAIDPWPPGRPALERRLANLDLLVVDDLHLAAGHPYLEASCSRVLARARALCRQVVLSTRDARGLRPLGVPAEETITVELGAPDLATRMRILERRAESEGLVLPADVARFVAQAFDRNVRELGGALVRLGAHAFFQRREITLGFAEEVLRPLLGRPEPPWRPRRGLFSPFFRGRVSDGPQAGEPGPLLEGIRELVEFAGEVGGGRIGTPDVRGYDILVPLVARDGERYLLRMRVGAYLAEPVSCAFVDERWRSALEAWPFPAERGPFRSPDIICTPPTAEFYRWHSERVYRRGEGTLVNTVAAVFAALHAPEYAGRFTRPA